MGNLFQQKKTIDHKYLVDKNKRIGDSSEWQQTNATDYTQSKFERFDTYNGLFNTQQFLGAIDFEDFSKHCFFNSAVSKVEYVFNQIYDDFPIDGTEHELNEFLNNLDGFGRYIYNQMDKNIGYLKFNDSYIEVQNKSGYLTSFNRNEKILSKLSKAQLNPLKSALSFDFRLNIIYDPIQSVQNQVIFQYLDKSNQRKNGFTLFIKEFKATSTGVVADLVFHMSNVTNNSKLVTKFSVAVNTWQHISICVNNNVNNTTKNSKQVKVWINSFLQIINDKIEQFNINDSLEIDNSVNFYLGKGESHVITDNNGAYNLGTSPNYLWGYIDEFRFLHQAIDESWIIKNKDKNIYAQDTLKLYFKFNEPTGVYEKNMFCFDSSGNSLHSRIQLKPFLTNNPDVVSVIRQMISDLRYNPTDENQPKPSLKFENDEFNPCLMPTFTKNKILNENLLTDAKDYDLFNPNLIFKLFPKHYFDEGAQFEGLSETFKSDQANTYYIFDSTSFDEDDLNYPGQQKAEGVQTFAKLLLIWAKFFDEIKIYLDVMPKLINIDYSNITTADNAINFFLPLMAKNAGFEFKEIMNSPTSKILDGYIIGLDGVDKSEFTLRFVQNELWKRILINSRDMLQSKGTKNAIRSIFNAIGVIPEDYYRFREYGSSQKKFIENSLLQKIKNIKFLNFYNLNNNLKLDLNLSYLASKMSYQNDSYSIEFFINYPFLNKNGSISDVLFTLQNINSSQNVLKIKYEKNKQDIVGQLKAIFYNNDNTESIITLTNVNLLNNQVSHISILVDNSDSNLTKFTLNFQYCSKNSTLLSESFIVFKSVNTLRLFANEANKMIKVGHETFNGQISNIKIWKNLLSIDDLKMHALDIQSLSNYELQLLKHNKISDVLLLNLSLQDDNFYQTNDQILPIDFSENNQLPTVNNENSYPFIIYGLNNIKPIDNLTFKTIVSYENDFKFDEPNIENKVNILSFQDDNLLSNSSNIKKVPVYEINYDKQKKNDVRFAIEMSNVKHLNEDIGKLFNSIDFFADIISDFGSLNDTAYNKFEKFSDFYFKRIKSNSIQMTPLYDLYQIFDNVLTEMLSEFISSRVKFNNNVYVVESHALERHKFHYKFLESHIVMKGDMSQSNINNSRKSFNYLKLEGRRLLQ